jgi:hypothetical protein
MNCLPAEGLEFDDVNGGISQGPLTITQKVQIK